MSEHMEEMHPKLTSSTFPLLVTCPVCKSIEGVACTRKVRDGMKFVQWFHYARTDYAMQHNQIEIAALVNGNIEALEKVGTSA